MNNEGDSWNDWMLLAGIFLALLVSGVLATMLTPVGETVAVWGLEVGLLVSGDDIVLPLVAGTGLDLGRIVLASLAVLFVLALVVVVATQLVGRQESRKGRRR